MTTLYKFAYIEDLKKIMVIELEAHENEFSFFVPPISCYYKTQLNKVNDDGIMFSLENNIDTFIQAMIEWEKEKQEKMREEYKRKTNESLNNIETLKSLNKDNDVMFFKPKER